jgi:hypothetical protein
MKGCARTCVLWLLGLAAAVAGFYFYLIRFGRLDPGIWWASGGAAVCTMLVVSYIVGIFGTSKERRVLLASLSGEPPVDGQWTAVSGQISSSSPLTAPLSGLTAVVYEYKIYRMERSGKSTSEVMYYEGKGLAPSTISTRRGGVKLLAVPTLEVDNAKLRHMQTVENARAYIDSTAFTAKVSMKEARKSTTEEMTDDDGMYRSDFQGSDLQVGLDECEFREKSIANGETICAFGLYSQSRGGLVPHENWAKQARIMRGDATSVAGKLMKRVIWYAVGVMFFGAAVYGIVQIYMAQAAK